jgi:hypothetical protein
MDDLTRRNVTQYVLWGVLSVAVGCLTALAEQLPGDDPLNWRAVASAGVSALLAVLVMVVRSMTLPKVGTEPVAVQVEHLKASGTPKAHMVVMDAGTKREAERAVRHAEAANAGEDVPTVDHEAKSERPG